MKNDGFMSQRDVLFLSGFTGTKVEELRKDTKLQNEVVRRLHDQGLTEADITPDGNISVLWSELYNNRNKSRSPGSGFTINMDRLNNNKE